MNVLQKVTLQSLKQNRSRTWITIVGILLSTAMLTAVSTMGASIKELFFQQTVRRYGSWSLACNITDAQRAELREDPSIDGMTCVQELGYSLLDVFSPAAYRPYWFVLGVEGTAQSLLPIELAAGRYPQNANEVLISQDTISWSNGDCFKLGGSVTLNLGTRSKEGQQLNFFDPSSGEETFTPTQTKTYQIVGVYQNDLSCLADTPIGGALLTVPEENADFPKWTFLHIKQSHAFRKLAQDPMPGVHLNHNLLLTDGFFPGPMGSVLRNLLLLVILLIMGASIAMIYNAFSISISERTRQFGLLSSVGATRRQQRSMVRYEALAVSALGIPLGMVSGLVGIGITLKILGPTFTQALGDEFSVPLRMVISPVALAASAGIALLTVLLSAQIPARRAGQISAIQAIRQNQDIAVSSKDVRIGRHGHPLFGFPGLLASKYYRRNHKKYRSTIFSLVTSIVLFVSAWTMTDYITFLANSAYPSNAPDLSYSTRDILDAEQILPQMQALPGVDDVMVEDSLLCHEVPDENGKTCEVWVNFVSENAWEKLLQENHLDPKVFNDPAAPLAVAVDGKVTHEMGSNTFVVNDLIAGNTLETTLRMLSGSKTFRAGAVLNQTSFYVQMGDRETPAYALIYPLRFRELLDIGIPSDKQIQIYANDPKLVQKQLLQHAYENGIPTWCIFNYAESISSIKSLAVLARVFFGGFLVLLTLIAVANIFNTISTNLSLRRRDFAMLKTVGMSPKEVVRMLQYECVLYGTRALLYGLPLAVLFSVAIDQIIGAGVKLGFRMPWFALIVAAIGVFVVVAISMAYAVYKLQLQPMLDTLKNENL